MVNSFESRNKARKGAEGTGEISRASAINDSFN